MSAESFNWPKKGIKAFVDKEGGKLFHLTWNSWPFPRLAEAYKTAADMILDAHQAAPRTPHNDDLFYPVAYLYRHCLEVKLKDVVWLGVSRHFFERSKVAEILEEHNLAKLWTKVKKLLKDRWPAGDAGPLKGVEAVINEIHMADQSGEKFRYETAKGTLKKYVHKKLPDRVNVQILRTTMDQVFTFLSASEDVMRDESGDWYGP